VKEYHKAIQAHAKHGNYSYYGIEGFLNAKLVADALKKVGKDPTREKLVSTLENGTFDLGGYRVGYSPTSHNGSRFVDLTVLGRDGRVLR
ncbi:MAG TPA: ABC transporter substrate-binding protein, partial [Zoogloea sp.]|nr:ABC transporter substrate-binding protein [Zoogloea sp.]